MGANLSKNYGGVVWTNHALERLKDRGIAQGDAWFTWKKPEQTRYAKSKGAFIYYRNYKDQKIELVAKQNKKGEWIIVSVWNRPIRTTKKNLPKENYIFTLIKRLFLKKAR